MIKSRPSFINDRLIFFFPICFKELKIRSALQHLQTTYDQFRTADTDKKRRSSDPSRPFVLVVSTATTANIVQSRSLATTMAAPTPARQPTFRSEPMTRSRRVRIGRHGNAFLIWKLGSSRLASAVKSTVWGRVLAGDWSTRTDKLCKRQARPWSAVARLPVRQKPSSYSRGHWRDHVSQRWAVDQWRFA